MGRAPCCEKNGLKRGPWTPEEDQKLIDYIQKHGHGNWRTLPRNAGLDRCGKSCRLRWTNYLRPDIKRGRFSFEEEETIIQLHSILGNKWSAIASRLPGRTDNEIKNYWNTHIRKRLLRMGIDPVTHSPRLDLLDLSSILNASLYANSSSQMNSIQRLLHMQEPMMNVNPEILKFASSLISSQQNENINFPSQNSDENHMKILELQNQIPQFVQIQDPVQEMPLNEQQLIELNNIIELCPPNFNEFSSQQNSQLSDWQTTVSTLAEDSVSELPSFCCYDSEQQQSFMEPPMSETSTFYSNNSNQSFSFTPVISTPSSSPTTLNSNSAYTNGSSTEDERESYGSNMLKYEIPDILDVSQFM